jgi:flagellar biosynthesis protein FliQ
MDALKLPFHESIDATLRTSKLLTIKIGLCVIVAVFVSVVGLFRETRREGSTLKFTPTVICAFALASVVVGIVGGLLLSYKDVVARRLTAGDRVNRLLHCYFAGGISSAFAWFVTILLVVFVTTIAACVLRII